MKCSKRAVYRSAQKHFFFCNVFMDTESARPWGAPSCRRSCVPPSCSSAPPCVVLWGGSTWSPGSRRFWAALWTGCGGTGPEPCSRSPARCALNVTQRNIWISLFFWKETVNVWRKRPGLFATRIYVDTQNSWHSSEGSDLQPVSTCPLFSCSLYSGKKFLKLTGTKWTVWFEIKRKFWFFCT